MYTAIQRQKMLDIAHRSIQHHFHLDTQLRVDHRGIDSSLLELRACFVTLKYQQQLCGCMGSLRPCQALVESIADNAYHAAFSDPRYPALNQRQLSGLNIHISVLTELSELALQSEQQLLDQLEPGRDGIVLTTGERTATFLPSVWRRFKEPETFIRQLKSEAGLADDYWERDLMIERFQVEEIGL